MFLDAIFMGGFPADTASPAELEGLTFFSGSQGGGGEMDCYVINRHQGYINGLFLDWSVRKIGLKELWTLKWHRTFDIDGPWTIAGFGGRADLCANAWDDPSEGAPWMKNFPEY